MSRAVRRLASTTRRSYAILMERGAQGRIYNLAYNPPKVPGTDDETGEALEQVRRRSVGVLAAAAFVVVPTVDGEARDSGPTTSRAPCSVV